MPKVSSWFFRNTCVSGGTERVIQTFPPITERVPITVSPSAEDTKGGLAA